MCVSGQLTNQIRKK